MTAHTPELFATAIVAAITGLMWVPIIGNRLREMGVWKALKNPQPDTRAKAAWAYRLSCAHRNAIENLVVFASLAVVLTLLGTRNEMTATASWIFVGSRLAHALIYAAGIPLMRTLAFAAGFLCQVALAFRICPNLDSPPSSAAL